MMKRAVVISFLLAAFAAVSCLKEPVPEGKVDGLGGLDITLVSGSALRLQTKTEADELLDGRRFKNVLVILVDNSGNIVGNVYKTYPYVPGTGDIQDAEGSDPVISDVIHFNSLLPGTYTVYAYANIDATAWQQTGANLISAQEQTATSGSFSSYLDRGLLGLTTAGTDVPADPSTSMLLTGKKSVSVGLSTASETVDLLRPVVRFKVTVRNHTGYPVTVDELRFSHFNPDKAFLIDHLDASGVPEVPAGVTYRALPAYDTSSPETVAANSEGVVYQTLLYENASPNAYKIFSTLTLDRPGDTPDLTLAMGEREFGVIDYQTLSEMDEGECVDVLLVNPQKNVRSGRLFYGIGSGYLAWESFGYTSYATLKARADAIYAEKAPFVYSGYSYNSTNGYSSWDAVGDPSTATSFDYTGAKNTHFRRITKSGKTYSIDGLAVNPATESSIDGLSVEQGAINDASKFPSDLDGSYLVRFKQSNGNYLQSDCNWGKTGDQAKYSYIKSVSGGTHQDRQFILFGKYCAGGKLKRILSDNNKEVPLTYMARNEDINVVINVYYADQDGSIDFEVDNAHWDDDGKTTSFHTFN